MKYYSVLGAELVRVLKKHENYVKSKGLFGMFSKDLRQMFLPKGFSLNDFEAFPKNVGIIHDFF